jgi:hypothetical protein
VVKGPPYLPSVSGDTICNDVVNDECSRTGTCKSCFTFNQADVDHIKSLGWNFIRLGVIWAGAQPRDEDQLDPDFVERLHAVLNLTDANGIHVMLDNHGDMWAGCGNGAPMWFQKKAAPHLIGTPPVTHFPYNLLDSINVKKVPGYEHCGGDATKWAKFAGDPNYNLLNECCLAMNSGNPGGNGFTAIAQTTLDYMYEGGEGRADFVRYWRLMAEAVKQHPSAFAFELMNEPLTIRRKWNFETSKVVADAIHEVIPDASVSLSDTGEGIVFPSWWLKLSRARIDLPTHIVEWIKNSSNVFYAWHYGDVPEDIKNAQEISKLWGIPTFGTELGCGQFAAAAEAGISHSYWHYSSYCNTGPAFGNRSVPQETFGACLLGWAGGDSSKCAQSNELIV